jgi:hypothetical protein
MRDKNNFSSLTTHPGHCHSTGPTATTVGPLSFCNTNWDEAVKHENDQRFDREVQVHGKHTNTTANERLVMMS